MLTWPCISPPPPPAGETTCSPGPAQQLERGHSWPGSRKNFSLLQVLWELPVPAVLSSGLRKYRIATTLCCGHLDMVEQLLHLYGQVSLLPKPGSLGSDAAQLTPHFPVISQSFPRFNLTSSSALFFRKVLLFLPRHGIEACSPLAGKLSPMLYLISV